MQTWEREPTSGSMRPWPEEADPNTGATPPPPEAPALRYGPRFAWRARLLWALGAILQLIGAAIVLATVVGATVVLPGTVAVIVLLATSAVVFLAARPALGRGEAWPATPSLVLGWALIGGGIGRSLFALLDHNLVIPLEPLVGIWLLMAADGPRLHVVRPADWRTAALTAVVILTELATVAPYFPAGLALFDRLGPGPEAFTLALDVPCPEAGALWQRVPVQANWHWEALDLFGNKSDRLTLDLASSGPAQLLWDPMGGNAQVTDSQGSTQIAYDIPNSTADGSLASDFVQSGDGTPTPFTITATFHHGSAWEVTRTASCPG